MILLDTSALAKLLVEEDASVALRAYLTEASGRGESLAISTLAVAELRRLAIRLRIAPEHVEPVVGPFRVLRLTEAILQLAGRLPHQHLGTLDALHVATGLAAEATGILTYDERQAPAARREGLEVIAPGR
jgi:predicted nucleic acid-binding protein